MLCFFEYYEVRQSKGLDQTISLDQPDQTCNHRILKDTWPFFSKFGNNTETNMFYPKNTRCVKIFFCVLLCQKTSNFCIKKNWSPELKKQILVCFRAFLSLIRTPIFLKMKKKTFFSISVSKLMYQCAAFRLK